MKDIFFAFLCGLCGEIQTAETAKRRKGVSETGSTILGYVFQHIMELSYVENDC
jgi:hypothetical protein